MGSTKGISTTAKEFGMGKAVGRTRGANKDVESELIKSIELKDKILEIAQVIMPLLKSDAEAGDIVKMLDRAGPMATLELIQLMATTKNEKIKYQAIKDILDRAGYKPPEKKINIHESVDRMSSQQLDAFLLNSFRNLDPDQRNKFVKLIKAPDGSYKAEDDMINEINSKPVAEG